MIKSKKHIKFGLVWFVALAVVAAVAFTGWFAYHSSQDAATTLRSANRVSSDIPKLPKVDSFQSCQKAVGSKLLQTYPEQCVTATGKKFVAATPQTLAIKEWGVQVAYTSSDTLSYVLNSDGSLANVVSKNLAQQYGADCDAWGAGTIYRQVGSDTPQRGGDGETVASVYKANPAAYTKVGSFYFSFGHDQAACQQDKITASLADAENAANSFTQTLVPQLVSTK